MTRKQQQRNLRSDKSNAPPAALIGVKRHRSQGKSAVETNTKNSAYTLKHASKRSHQYSGVTGDSILSAKTVMNFARLPNHTTNVSKQAKTSKTSLDSRESQRMVFELRRLGSTAEWRRALSNTPVVNVTRLQGVHNSNRRSSTRTVNAVHRYSSTNNNNNVVEKNSEAKHSRTHGENRQKLTEDIVIDSDDEDTYYTFSDNESQKQQPHTSQISAENGTASSQKLYRLTRANPSTCVSSKSTRSHGIVAHADNSGGSSVFVARHGTTKPLAVVCEESSIMAHVEMPPPPSPFTGMRNSNNRPVARIPISPYTRSPPSLTSPTFDTRAIHSDELRRLTRSTPVRSPDARLSSGSHVSTESSPSSRRYIDSPEKGFLTSTDSRGNRKRAVTPLTFLSPGGARAASPASSERRLSVRQSECAFKYKDILVKRYLSFTQVILNTTVGSQKNVLTLKALQELTTVLNNTKYDDSSHVVLLTGSDNGTFCSGLDLAHLTSGDIHQAARSMSDALSELIRAVLAFPKPLVAAVNGEAVGCGVALLPLCDIVYASDKATFFTPYTQLGQVPEAGLSSSLPQIIGMALANEMLMAGRMLTALEAYQMGLVAQVFWPTSMMQEVIPRIANMATACSSRVLNATKSLIRSQHRERLLAASHTEANMLAEIWSTPECQRNMKLFLEHFGSV